MFVLGADYSNESIP